ncbi:hypothetical protein LF1_21830 [Rubripirellula obstinata]|uniref:Uncharacterized protein n=1 Tax=Rubripirellula obstinata TaxID=406547 RepID=A0A5B1CES3_9BACT|nr:hypothetical protein LF1_21830 [Rubripirellula obstinata]
MQLPELRGACSGLHLFCNLAASRSRTEFGSIRQLGEVSETGSETSVNPPPTPFDIVR